MKATHILSKGSSFSCQIRQLKFLERSGFQLDKLTTFAYFSTKGLVLRKANLQTSKSRLLIPKLALRTRSSEDFNAFDDRVVFDAVMAPSKLNLHDIAYFAPEMRGMDQTVYVSGVVKDKLRELRIQDLNLRFGKATQICNP